MYIYNQSKQAWGSKHFYPMHVLPNGLMEITSERYQNRMIPKTDKLSSWATLYSAHLKQFNLSFKVPVEPGSLHWTYLHIHLNAKCRIKVNCCLAFFCSLLCMIHLLLTGTRRPWGSIYKNGLTNLFICNTLFTTTTKITRIVKLKQPFLLNQPLLHVSIRPCFIQS